MAILAMSRDVFPKLCFFAPIFECCQSAPEIRHARFWHVFALQGSVSRRRQSVVEAHEIATLGGSAFHGATDVFAGMNIEEHRGDASILHAGIIA
jgi:hypothetical protein